MEMSILDVYICSGNWPISPKMPDMHTLGSLEIQTPLSCSSFVIKNLVNPCCATSPTLRDEYLGQHTKLARVSSKEIGFFVHTIH